MIVLHGTWVPLDVKGLAGEFFIWGESSTYTKTSRRGRPPKVAPHPFQANRQELIDSLKVINSERNSQIEIYKHLKNIRYNLPSRKKAPQPSERLFYNGDQDPSKEPLQMKTWEIDGLSMKHEDALKLLVSLSEFGLDTKTIRIGTDLIYWSRLSKLFLELILRQKFIPRGLEINEGVKKGNARWKILLDKMEDRITFSEMIQSIPPVCTSILQFEKCGFSKENYVFNFLDFSINECIRNWFSTSRVELKKDSLAKAWLDSLLFGKPMKTNGISLKRVSKEIASWTKSFDDDKQYTFRTSFRLDPPPPESSAAPKPWILHYHLQALDDPTLLISAKKIWKESKDVLHYINRIFYHPQEKLLHDLEKASHLFSPIEQSLHSACPVCAHLTTQEAYLFLKESEMLRESGFGVLIPAWWKNGGSKNSIGLKVKLTSKKPPKSSKGILTFTKIIDYDWEIALGKEPITKEEFENLSKLKEPIVQFRGKWVVLKEDDIEKTINFFKKKRSGTLTLPEALKLVNFSEDKKFDLPINEICTSQWISKLIKQLSREVTFPKLTQPEGFEGKLRPYQTKGYSWMASLTQCGLGACLADDMGLGKTIQCLALLLKQKNEGVETPNLLICPTSIIGNWKREANRFVPSLKVMVHHGKARLKGITFLKEAKSADLIISSYSLTHRDEEELLNIEWNGVILDEAQNIKNYYTKTSQSVRKLNSNYRLALTGTPMENRLLELWSIIDFLNPGYLGTAVEFRKKIAIPIEKYNDSEATTRLKKIIQPFILRRLKTDPRIIKDLPEKIEIKTYCNLTKEQATLYQAIVKDIINRIENESGIKRKGLVLSALTRLKQVCDHPALFLGDNSAISERSGKLKRLVEMLEEILSEGHSALIFSQYAKMGKILKKVLEETFGQEVLFLYGGLSQKVRDQMVLRFLREDGPNLFILSIKAGGVGLNLTKASHVFHFDRWWNPAVENQATDRAYRIGQTQNVMVYKFICEGTLEQRIDDLINSKKKLVKDIIGSGEGWLTNITNKELREILMLKKDIF
ncbi:MAG: ATP-dependent helicase [Candidatus Lokiarchaeota archaeon]|nr:ATP-dependent helicase [Candidatus Lokiarchaeota archaeon]MBD3343036.1 ATP-dependent helicase [Candidatus Lokiarchaeota archaeon]